MLMQEELVLLLGAIAKGDTAAFEQLYNATRAKLYGVLLRILGRPELAEEVMQETYLKVWKMADKFDPAQASPITWMVAIARNRATSVTTVWFPSRVMRPSSRICPMALETTSRTDPIASAIS